MINNKLQMIVERAIDATQSRRLNWMELEGAAYHAKISNGYFFIETNMSDEGQVISTEFQVLDESGDVLDSHTAHINAPEREDALNDKITKLYSVIRQVIDEKLDEKLDNILRALG